MFPWCLEFIEYLELTSGSTCHLTTTNSNQVVFWGFFWLIVLFNLKSLPGCSNHSTHHLHQTGKKKYFVSLSQKLLPNFVHYLQAVSVHKSVFSMKERTSLSWCLNVSVACSLDVSVSLVDLFHSSSICFPPSSYLRHILIGTGRSARGTGGNSIFIKILSWKCYTVTHIHIPLAIASYLAKFKINGEGKYTLPILVKAMYCRVK